MGGGSSTDRGEWNRRPPSFRYRNSSYQPYGESDPPDSLEKVIQACQEANLECSNIIVGVDFTKSNKWTGKHSFNGRCLHHVGDTLNPYEQAISIIGHTLSTFDEDNLIPCFGFGDASTHDNDIFSFYPNGRQCHGFFEVLARYREIVPHVQLAGPTSFAPIIEMGMRIVERSGGLYHILIIITDSQVTGSGVTTCECLSYQEKMTLDAIIKASKFPMSIILVGVGDGPWDMMKKYDDNIPGRSFDNFQFVNFTEIMSKDMAETKKAEQFALAASMKIPSQYTAVQGLGILGNAISNWSTRAPNRIPLSPPVGRSAAALSTSNNF